MAEAINSEFGVVNVLDTSVEDIFLIEDEKEKAVSSIFHSSISSDFSTWSTNKSFPEIIRSVVRDDKMAALVFDALSKNGLDNYEKHLGSGCFASVFQIEGSGKFEGQKLALKLSRCDPYWFTPVQSTTCYSQYLFSTDTERSLSLKTRSANLNHFLKMGHCLNVVTKEGIPGDGIALKIPKGDSLSSACGVFLFDGECVEFVEEIDVERDLGKAVLAMLLPAVEGGTLGQRIRDLPIDSDAVKGYGRSLAESIHQFHAYGYAHRDIHSWNILLLSKESNPYGVQLIDYGLAKKITSLDSRCDWASFAWVLSTLEKACPEKSDPLLADLLHNEKKGLLNLSGVPYSEEEILNHPYFA